MGLPEILDSITNAISSPVKLTVHGEERLIAPPGWSEQKNAGPGFPAPLTISTLSGIDDYVRSNRDMLDLTGLTCHVRSEREVHLVGSLLEDQRWVRHVYVASKAEPAAFRFGEYLNAENAIVGLQTAFVRTDALERLVALISNIKEETVRDTVDDGVAQQEVITKGGVTMTARANVPNPIALKPYRTFFEIDQPESLYVVRMKSGQEGGKPTVALFEAEGGIWRQEAMKSIKEYLINHLPTEVVAGVVA